MALCQPGNHKVFKKNKDYLNETPSFQTPEICFVFLCVPKKADTYHVADKVFTYNLK